jgi:hypothetical protein
LIKSKKVLLLEIIGTIFILLLGASFHFTFALSYNNPIVGSISAVNESVWEHLKLPFWPSIFWLLITMYPMRKIVGNFFSAKALGAAVMLIIIPVVFYSYTIFTKEILAVDVATFVVAVVVGQVVSFRFYKRERPSKLKEILAVALILSIAILLVAFTFYPPELSIFMDSETGSYGMG